jgi:two-component system NtrC family sensor kinase
MPFPAISLRLRLTLGALLPLIVAIVVCSLIGAYIINSQISSQAQDKVRTDLNSAREVYLNEIAHVRDVVRLSAKAIENGDRSAVATLLAAQREHEQLDILTAVDPDGRVLYRAGNPKTYGDLRSNDPMVVRALAGKVSAGSEVLPPEQLALEGAALATQATIQVLPTPHAKPSDKQLERSGMVLIASAPIREKSGRIIGALYGGILLNGNNALVDKIKRIVYEGIRFQGEDVGTATIFLDDLRITTNVQTVDGKRAIGTRLSGEVYDRVIVNKEKWVDRAFVVKDWYFSAYEPILDINGRVIGSLYVGMLERPYAAVKRNVTYIFGAVLLLGSLLGLVVSGYIGKRLARPIKELQNLVKRFSAGERGVQIAVTTKDEIGDLAAEFNQMTLELAGQEEEIRCLNRDLERKVRERTAELEEKTLQLIKAREELVRAEKLAAVGELAAGVAHEINNPMAIIRGNTELLRMALAAEDPNLEEVDIIYRQVSRVERIVANLLRFARREKRQLVATALSPLLDEILGQVGHQVSLDGITVVKQYQEQFCEVAGDSEQLRQVFTNLILNAVQAMPDGGVLTVSAAAPASGECSVTIADTGFGIAAENIEQVFNPFFTTRAAGTGLGLAVSYGIVRDHGGRLEVESVPGKGAQFHVVLPLCQ